MLVKTILAPKYYYNVFFLYLGALALYLCKTVSRAEVKLFLPPQLNMVESKERM